MRKIMLSIPDDMLKKIDDYSNKREIKRNQFILKAIKNYLFVPLTEEYFYKRREAVSRIRRTSEKIMKAGTRNWDPVKEIRKTRDTI
jgi:metal-responsive CopG/Arc/MetJ family transcriptional regulator